MSIVIMAIMTALSVVAKFAVEQCAGTYTFLETLVPYMNYPVYVFVGATAVFILVRLINELRKR